MFDIQYIEHFVDYIIYCISNTLKISIGSPFFSLNQSEIQNCMFVYPHITTVYTFSTLTTTQFSIFFMKEKTKFHFSLNFNKIILYSKLTEISNNFDYDKTIGDIK